MNCYNNLLTDLTPNGIPLVAKSIGRVWFKSKLWCSSIRFRIRFLFVCCWKWVHESVRTKTIQRIGIIFNFKSYEISNCINKVPTHLEPSNICPIFLQRKKQLAQFFLMITLMRMMSWIFFLQRFISGTKSKFQIFRYSLF